MTLSLICITWDAYCYFTSSLIKGWVEFTNFYLRCQKRRGKFIHLISSISIHSVLPSEFLFYFFFLFFFFTYVKAMKIFGEQTEHKLYTDDDSLLESVVHSTRSLRAKHLYHWVAYTYSSDAKFSPNRKPWQWQDKVIKSDNVTTFWRTLPSSLHLIYNVNSNKPCIFDILPCITKSCFSLESSNKFDFQMK